MSSSTRSHPEFQHGLAVAAMGGGFLLIALYTLYAPTSDIRARIPFLLEMSGGLLTLLALAVLFAAGVVALRITGPITKRALGGAALAALANVLVLTSGLLPRILPPFEGAVGRWTVFAMAAVVAGLLLVRLRLGRYPSSPRSPS